MSNKFIQSEDESQDKQPEEGPEAVISFGALAKAQQTLRTPFKRQGLIEAKSHKTNSEQGDGWEDNEALERKAGKNDHRDFGRSNKHAPAEVSSKKAVSRKREVVAVAKREIRDPRFDHLSGHLDNSKLGKAYSFLDDYREDEMKALKEQIKKTKDEFERERLKRALLSMESKKKAQERKKKEQEILDKHRKEEKELVKEGKKPFYLKKAEQKKRFLTEQYSGLKGKQLDHAIERKRRKVEGKEKKRMPLARRGAQDTL